MSDPDGNRWKVYNVIDLQERTADLLRALTETRSSKPNLGIVRLFAIARTSQRP